MTYFVVANDSVNVQVNVIGCNNNFICESMIGEDVASCPNDCTPVVNPTSTPSDPDIQPPEKKYGQKKKIILTVDSQIITDKTINILWSSNVPVNANISWSSNSGQSGIIQEVGFTNTHSLFITNLISDTSYKINIEVQDLNGNIVTKEFYIRTEKNITQIFSVQDFDIREQGGGAILMWKNPETNFEYVRIVKSVDFFPRDPYDGDVIYEGSAQSFFDSEIEKDTRYFYSIFVKNNIGFSNGVGDTFILKPRQEFYDVGEPITTFGPIYDQTIITNLDVSDIHDQIHFYQNDNELTRANNSYHVENKKEILITIDALKEFKSSTQMYISYFNSSLTNQPRDYIFEYDQKQKRFSVRFMISNNEPSSPFIIYIRNNQEIKGYLGYFNSTVSFPQDKKYFFGFLLANDLIPSLIGMFILVFFINIWWLLFLLRRKKKQEEIEEKKEENFPHKNSHSPYL